MLLWAYRLPIWIIFAFVGIALLFGTLLYSKCTNNTANKWRMINIALLILSIYIIFDSTLLNRSDTVKELHTEPFRLLRLAKDNYEVYRSIILNIVLFLPFGITFVSGNRRSGVFVKIFSAVIAGITLSVIVETLQYTLSLGEAELDDIICNGMGAFLGATIALLNKIFIRIKCSNYYDKRILKFLIITFLFSWGFWAPLSYFSVHGPFYFSHPLSNFLYIVGGFGPTVAGFIILFENSNSRELLKRFLTFKKRTIFTLFIFCVIECLFIAASSLQINSQYLSYRFLILLVQSIFILGGNEEIGWRGVMQPLWEEKMPYTVSSIFTGVIWAIWHIPLWYVNGSSQENYSFLLFTIFAIVLSFWFSALYNKTKSICACCILHGFTNTLLNLFILRYNWILYLSSAIIIIISIIIANKKSERF